MKFTDIVLLNELKQVELSQIRDTLRNPPKLDPKPSTDADYPSDDLDPWERSQKDYSERIKMEFLDPMNKVQEMLFSKGWRPLGNMSFYSAVYENPNSPFIIKILSDGWDMRNDKSSRCALQWLRYCSRNPTNPYLPRIHYLKTVSNPANKDLTRYLIVMERLEELDGVGAQRNWNPDLQNENDVIETALLYTRMRDERSSRIVIGMGLINWAKRTNVVNDDLKSMLGDVEELGIDWLKDKIIVSIHDYLLDHTDHPLAKALEAMRVIMEKNGCSNDLHHQNLMYRPSTDTLVLTDPLPG